MNSQLKEEQTHLDQLFDRVVEASGGEIRKRALVPARGLKQTGWITSFLLQPPRRTVMERNFPDL